MNIKPTSDRLIVEPLEADAMTKGGLHIPDQSKERPQKGKVVAIGPGAIKENGFRAVSETKPGDTVLYSKYSGAEVTVEGRAYVILREGDILAVL